MKKSDYSFPEELIPEIYYNHCEFNYHYGSDGCLYSSSKYSGAVFVLYDGIWRDIQAVDFNMEAMHDDLEVDSQFIFDDDLTT